jgi:phage baseplate assembly protein gpV
MQLVPVTAAVSTLVANNIDITFDTPRVVLPGEFVATVVKHRGTVATAGTVAHGILFDTYWE